MGGVVDGRADQYALAATAFQLLTGKPLFQHSNQAVVISQHINAEPPDIADRRPELSALSPVFAKALAKSPADRFANCQRFARALEMQLGVGDHDPADADATQLALPADESTPKQQPSRRNMLLVAGIASAVLLVALVATFAVLELRPSSGPDAETGSAAGTGSATPSVPVVIIGADCATLGAAGVSPTGAQAYCAHLSTINAPIWSLYAGPVASPTVTPGPTDEVYPPDIEQQVRVCAQQTGKSRLECREDVRRGNITGPA